jgi:hypothetical protein
MIRLHINGRSYVKIDDWITFQAMLNKASSKELRRMAQMVEKAAEEKTTQSPVERYVPYGDGYLQLEYRVNPKTGTRRGPYWTFRYQESGRQKMMYLGKVGEDEAKRLVDERRR